MFVNFVLDDSVLQVSVLSELTLDMHMFFAMQGCIALVHTNTEFKHDAHALFWCMSREREKL